MKSFLLLICFFCTVWTSMGQRIADCKKWDALVDSKSVVSAKETKSTYYLIHLHEDFDFTNSQLVRRLDGDHQIVYFDTKQSGLTPVNNQWKLSNNTLLNDQSEGTFIIKTKANTRLLANNLRNQKAEILKQQNGRLVVRTNSEILKSFVLNNNDVLYIGKENIKPHQESEVSDLNPTINGINTLKKAFPELTGANKIIGVKDNQFRGDDIDLIGKKVDSPIASELIDNHATDMSTIIGGLGNSSATSLGVSSEASIFLSDFNEVFPDSQVFLDNAQVSIQNHSYGTEIESFYGELAQGYDNAVFENPQMLHVFSSGNSGLKISENGVYSGVEGFANLTGNFKMAKNTLLVGAMNELRQVTDFSSKGPAHDGRIKPELVAYSFEGTSNTAAMVSAAALLAQQAYENETGSLPSASMLKALLINAADDIETRGPDFKSGYGSLNVKNTIDIIKAGRYINDEVSSNETKIVTITIPENAKNLKVTLVWTDPPANANDNIALVNDLDLKIISSTNQETLPWVLNSEATLEVLQAPATRDTDTLNNVEQIGIKDILPGNYSISITGKELVSNQVFAVAYSWEEQDQFSWIYPLENENYPYNGEFFRVVRWDQSLAENTIGSLAVSYNGSVEWELISDNLTLKNEFYQWDPPEGFVGTAQLRMTIDGSNFLSESFTISQRFNVQVPLNCETIVELNWPKIETVDDYRIYNLQGQKMEMVAEVRDTLFTFNKTSYATPYFAVAPLLNETTEGIRTGTINYTNFNENCYFSILFAELNEDQNAILVSSELSSLTNIESISVVKIGLDGTESIIETLVGLDSPLITILDENPDFGQNNYQFRINTTLGSTISSDLVTAFFFTENEPYLLFPNPVRDSGVNVYSSKVEDEIITFELFDANGRSVLKKELNSDREFVEMDGLQSGLFLYRINSSINKTSSGKLIINKNNKP